MKLDSQRVREQFWAKVDKTGDCWLWTAACNPKGYGKFRATGTAHRIAYIDLVGPIPEGMELDHLCRVRNCVNPDHLEPVTSAENTLRGDSFAGRHARQTSCLRGHPFDTRNTRLYRGRRVCRACERLRRGGLRNP